MISDPAVLLVGCGKMGGAMLRGWLAAGLTRIRVVEPGPSILSAEDAARVGWHDDAVAVPANFRPDVLVLAVKPQVMDAVAPAYAARVQAAAASVVSIAAGRTIAGFEAVFGQGTPIVRAMPNLPASIGRGVTVAVANAATDPARRDLATRLLQACGPVEWVEDEVLIDPVTALSGGGPAYVFLLVEALAAAGARLGLDAEMAMRLARATVAGSGALLDQSDQPADALRRAVTSPGGTTQAALGVLMDPTGLQPLVDRALAAASARAGELAG